MRLLRVLFAANNSQASQGKFKGMGLGFTTKHYGLKLEHTQHHIVWEIWYIWNVLQYEIKIIIALTKIAKFPIPNPSPTSLILFTHILLLAFILSHLNLPHFCPKQETKVGMEHSWLWHVLTLFAIPIHYLVQW